MRKSSLSHFVIREKAIYRYILAGITLLLMVLLTSCSHLRKKDGPPNFYVDETKIPNATPKVEPLAKYGNMPSYRVFGKRYYTMKSSKHFEQVGTASWYGTQFHDQRTSSGEKYDMLGMTAAHKTLPLPTYVEVTNLKNNRKIIVKVNDRGPFATNRIIDLSYVAAKKLNMLGHGTTFVRIKAIDPATYGRSSFADNAERAFSSRRSDPYYESKPTWSSADKKAIYLQVGAFRNRPNAERLKRQLMPLLSTPVHIANPSVQSHLYQVKVGPIRDVATANKISHRLRTLGIKSNKHYGA